MGYLQRRRDVRASPYEVTPGYPRTLASLAASPPTVTPVERRSVVSARAPRFIVVDDHPLVRESISFFLSKEKDLEVVDFT